MALVTESQLASDKTPAATFGKSLILSGKLDPFIPEARRKDAAALYSACLAELNARTATNFSEASVGQCLAASAKLWLPPGLPEAYCHFVPRKDDGIAQFGFTMTYRGIVHLAYRSGFLVRLDAEYVLKGETFRHRHTTDKGVRIFHELPANRPEFKLENLECVYATWQTRDGAVSGFVVPAWKVVRLHGKSQNSSPWRSNPDAMARKTAVKHAASYLPLGEDVALAARIDEDGDDLPPVLLDVPTDPRSSDKSAASAAAMLRMVVDDPVSQGRVRQWILSQPSASGLSEDLAVCQFLSVEASRDSARAYLRSCSTEHAAI